MRPSKWHQESFLGSNKTCSWNDYIPYTNVLWLRYLFNMLVLKLKKDCPPATISKIEVEAKELKRRFDVRTKVVNGAFSTAEDVLTWMIQAGWVTEDQIAGDTTFLSEA
jgi:serine/threonine-protein kinase haspin